MKNKIRKQMRGFDVAQYLAFHTFPKIKNISIWLENDQFCAMDTRTGEIQNAVIIDMNDCTAFAKRVNKMIKSNNQYFAQEEQ